MQSTCLFLHHSTALLAPLDYTNLFKLTLKKVHEGIGEGDQSDISPPLLTHSSESLDIWHM